MNKPRLNEQSSFIRMCWICFIVELFMEAKENPTVLIVYSVKRIALDMAQFAINSGAKKVYVHVRDVGCYSEWESTFKDLPVELVAGVADLLPEVDVLIEEVWYDPNYSPPPLSLLPMGARALLLGNLGPLLDPKTLYTLLSKTGSLALIQSFATWASQFSVTEAMEKFMTAKNLPVLCSVAGTALSVRSSAIPKKSGGTLCPFRVVNSGAAPVRLTTDDYAIVGLRAGDWVPFGTYFQVLERVREKKLQTVHDDFLKILLKEKHSWIHKMNARFAQLMDLSETGIWWGPAFQALVQEWLLWFSPGTRLRGTCSSWASRGWRCLWQDIAWCSSTATTTVSASCTRR